MKKLITLITFIFLFSRQPLAHAYSKESFYGTYHLQLGETYQKVLKECRNDLNSDSSCRIAWVIYILNSKITLKEDQQFIYQFDYELLKKLLGRTIVPKEEEYNEPIISKWDFSVENDKAFFDFKLLNLTINLKWEKNANQGKILKFYFEIIRDNQVINSGHASLFRLNYKTFRVKIDDCKIQETFLSFCYLDLVHY